VVTVIVVVTGIGVALTLGRTDDGQPASHHTPTTAAVTTPPAVATAKPAQLDSFLLSPEQINALVGTTGIVVDHNATEMTDPGPENTVSDPRCLGALIGYQTPTYKSSGYTAMLAQLLKKPNSSPGYVVVQGAVIFASADQPLVFVGAQAEQWRNCAGRSVTQVNNGTTTQWTFREISGNPPNIALAHSSADGAVVCQHVLSAVSNVVVDVNVCAPGTINQARLIANQVAAKVPK
jgi:serine/threonine-protein kinase